MQELAGPAAVACMELFNIMDTRTGKIYGMEPGETLSDLSKRTGVPEKRLVQLQRQPDPKCPKCAGKGYKPQKGQKPKRRFKLMVPCACTQ